MIPITAKLTRYAAYAGHWSVRASPRCRKSCGVGMVSTSKVIAIAKTPSLNVSRRALPMRGSVTGPRVAPIAVDNEPARDATVRASAVEQGWGEVAVSSDCPYAPSTSSVAPADRPLDSLSHGSTAPVLSRRHFGRAENVLTP